jgi:hypothetical protein
MPGDISHTIDIVYFPLNILIVASLLYVLYSIYQKYAASRLTTYGTIY